MKLNWFKRCLANLGKLLLAAAHNTEFDVQMVDGKPVYGAKTKIKF